jgi:hypothetical protein
LWAARNSFFDLVRFLLVRCQSKYQITSNLKP